MHRFLLKYLESIRKRKIGHTWQHADFPRELIALRFRCLIYAPLRKRTPCNRFHVLSVEALANRRHLRGVLCLVRCRGVMSGSESVPPRKALKRCMLFRQCCEAHIHRNHAKQSPLTKAASISVAYTLLSGGVPSLSFSDAPQNIAAKNII